MLFEKIGSEAFDDVKENKPNQEHLRPKDQRLGEGVGREPVNGRADRIHEQKGEFELKVPQMSEFLSKFPYCYDEMRVLILDFDGVLAPSGRHLTQEWDTDEYGVAFDPACVIQLSRILAATGARVVISSSWRHDGWENLRELWCKRNMPGHLFDMLPSRPATTPLTEPLRGQCLREWLDEQDRPVQGLAILDDQPVNFGSDWSPYLVATDPRTGLTAAQADEVIQRLLTAKYPTE